MTDFKLPDLGEGLPDAEIVQWLVKEGDTVKEGDNMVEMSTAKAVVEVPAPYSGKIVKLHGKPGDVIETGAVLVSFEVEGDKGGKEPEKAQKGKEKEDQETQDEGKKDKAEKEKDSPSKSETQKDGADDKAAGRVFKLPDLGEGLPDAEIVKWLVEEGEILKEGENMVEMSTAKAVVEVPAPFSGQVKKLFGKAGDVIKTGAPLIEIETGGGTKEKSGGKCEKPKMKAVKEAKGDSGTVVGAVQVGEDVTSETRADAAGIKASAAARALARKLKVDLKGIEGSGPGGAITQGDVKKAAEGREKAEKPTETFEIPDDLSISPAARTTARALGLDARKIRPEKGAKMITKGDVLKAAREASGGPRAQKSPVATSKEVKAAPKVRTYAASKGIDLKNVQPTGHVGNITLADVETAEAGPPGRAEGPYSRPERPYEVSGEPQKLAGPRRVMAQAMAKANAEVCHTSIFDEVSLARWGGKPDITVRIMRSIIAASFAEPALNAWFDGEKLEKTTHKSVHLGVAVDSPKGLFVPVIKDADQLDGEGLRKELNRLRQAIDEGTIKTSEMSGATITLSNFGMIAGRYATPIVSPPEVAIVGIGGLFEKLVMTEKGIENQRFIPVSLTFDHRASTGGEAARFLAAILNDLALAF